MPLTLGQRVRELRVRRGLSQVQLCGNTISASYLSLIEAGKRMPGRDVVATLAARLGTTPHYLETGADADDILSERVLLSGARMSAADGDIAGAREKYRVLANSPRKEIANQALCDLSEAERELGEYGAALTCLDLLERPAREHEPGAPSRLRLMIMQSTVCRELGDYVRSAEVGEAGLEELASLGLTGSEDELRLANTLIMTYEARGDLVSAQRLSARVMAAAERLGEPASLGQAYWRACRTSASRGDLPLALECAEKALRVLPHVCGGEMLPRFRVTYAWLLMRFTPPRVDEAADQLSQAHLALAKSPPTAGLAGCETEMARAALLRRDLPQAIRLAGRAVKTSRACGHRTTEHLATAVRGLALIAAGDTHQGVAVVTGAAAELETLLPMEAARVYRDLAERLLERGLVTEAVAALRQASDAVGVRSPLAPLPDTGRADPKAAG
jgi:transcriptional regulator with XRE-family HTH domain